MSDRRRRGHPARDPHGRRPRRHGCGRLPARGGVRRLRGRADEHPVRCDAIRTGAGHSSCSGGYARELWAHDYPWGVPEAEYRAALERMRLGRPQTQEQFEESARNACPNGDRCGASAPWRGTSATSASPGAFMSLARNEYGIDVRDVLGAIRMPTLVLQCVRWGPMVPLEQGRDLAERIPGSTCRARLCGLAHSGRSRGTPIILGPVSVVLGACVEQRRRMKPREPDRVLATVLFTDIVGSSERR